MKFGIFYEHQIPRPWTDGAEHRLLQDALDQVELADKLGIDYAWEVEHHFLEEYSHSSAPEVFLAAASQRTKNIRLGHGIIQLTTNHPARVAERVSTLDLLSNGRVEFGMGESASNTELDPFGVRFEDKREKLTKGDDGDVPRFIGQDVLQQVAADGPQRPLGGLILDGRRVARQGAAVRIGDDEIGFVTSGCSSPTVGKSIAMAYLDAAHATVGTRVDVDLGRAVDGAAVVELPFYKS